MKDNVCDPDCLASQDGDCPLPSKDSKGTALFIVAASGIIIILGLWYYHKKKIEKRVNKILEDLRK